MINGQLELSFTGAHEQHPWTRRQRHLSRARWWFERMRQVVDRAIDWPPAPAPRPEQTWFAEASRQALPAAASRQAAAAQGSNDQERQICE
jgi:hypothetical protein